jgi:RHS repeat-associated protein
LKTIVNPQSSIVNQYNGLGDRLTQNGVNYTLDLNAGLTQVLTDGTNQYLYGVGRIAQVNTTTLITDIVPLRDYFLTDALGSVRQLTDSQGEITRVNAYEPYGVLAQSAGSAQTSYRFTGEFTDPSGMVYLRARFYMPTDGRFLTRDTWMGEYNRPLSLNRWNYTSSNPINYTDPTGQCPEGWIKNPNGTCSFSIFEFLPGGGFIFTVPEELTWLFCEDQTSIFQQAYATPTVTPQPYTSTPGSIVITPTPIQTQVYGTPTQTPTQTPVPNFVRARHYDQQINLIHATMLIKSADGLAVWVEYPVITPYNEGAIQATTLSFMRPLNGRGGFVEFNVDVNKWRMEPDPNLPWLRNAKIIWLGNADDLKYIGVGFPLSDPGVAPLFFDWKGHPI